MKAAEVGTQYSGSKLQCQSVGARQDCSQRREGDGEGLGQKFEEQEVGAQVIGRKRDRSRYKEELLKKKDKKVNSRAQGVDSQDRGDG